MAFNEALLPKGAITLQEFMKKHDPEDIEGYRVSYLLPDGKPLEYGGLVFEGLEAKLTGTGKGSSLACDPPYSGRRWIAMALEGWKPTFGWDMKVSPERAERSAIVVLDYLDSRRIGKPAKEWMNMEGFKSAWFDGAQFEGREGHLTRDKSGEYTTASPAGWNSTAQRNEARDWLREVREPWVKGTRLYLTPENEAKALAGGELDTCATCESRDNSIIAHEDNSCATVLEALKGLIEEWRSTRNCCQKAR